MLNNQWNSGTVATKLPIFVYHLRVNLRGPRKSRVAHNMRNSSIALINGNKLLNVHLLHPSAKNFIRKVLSRVRVQSIPIKCNSILMFACVNCRYFSIFYEVSGKYLPKTVSLSKNFVFFAHSFPFLWITVQRKAIFSILSNFHFIGNGLYAPIHPE